MTTAQTASPASNFFERSYEALAFVAPIVLFSGLAAIRIVVFIQTQSLVALLNAAALAVLTSMFVIRKPAKDVDRSFKSLAVAWIGNFLPFAFILKDRSDWAGPAPSVIEVVTVTLAVWTVLSLRDSMGVAPANRGVKTGGPYGFIRHPLYTLVIISQVGLLLAYPSPFNIAILATAVVFKGKMILNEERILKRDPLYVEYSSRVRYRVVPGLF